MLSFCTVCKNRAHHLKQTIFKNIEHLKNFPDVEMIILDYNSDDDLESWIYNNLIIYINSGLLKYYKTFGHKYFHRSHSRNMVFRLANGDWLCNVDADNYVGPGFISFLNDHIKRSKNIFMCAGGQHDSISCSDIGGRICLSARDFSKIGGYDESMANYGFEDYDLIQRLEMLKLDKILIKDKKFLNHISHDRNERISEEFAFKNTEKIFIKHINPGRSSLIIFFLDGTIKQGEIYKGDGYKGADNEAVFFSNSLDNGIQLLNNSWNKGFLIKKNSNGFEIAIENSERIMVLDSIDYKKETINLNEDYCYKRIHDKRQIEEIIFYYSKISNKNKLEENRSKGIICPNSGIFGNGIVYKNFDYDNPIVLT